MRLGPYVPGGDLLTCETVPYESGDQCLTCDHKLEGKIRLNELSFRIFIVVNLSYSDFIRHPRLFLVHLSEPDPSLQMSHPSGVWCHRLSPLTPESVRRGGGGGGGGGARAHRWCQPGPHCH